MRPPQYRDRAHAGKKLAVELAKYAHRHDVIVLALPRGGVPVAVEIAEALHVPLDVFVVRKLGLPIHDEYAMGAVASGGARVLNAGIIKHFGISQEQVAEVTRRELEELERREALYRDGTPFPEIKGMTVILVDDGLATGATMLASVQALRAEEPAHIIVAVPVSSTEVCSAFRDVVEEIVCGVTPDRFTSVGEWYEDFSQTTDEDVHDLLARSRHEPIRR